jgi:hypothetical protein
MNREFLLFLLRITLATIILAGLGWILFIRVVPEMYLQILPWMLLFFFAITLLTYMLQHAARKNMRRFTHISMIVSMLRLILYSSFAFIYLYKKPENAVVFIACLAVCYIVYTLTEVCCLSKTKENRKE